MVATEQSMSTAWFPERLKLRRLTRLVEETVEGLTELENHNNERTENPEWTSHRLQQTPGTQEPRARGVFEAGHRIRPERQVTVAADRMEPSHEECYRRQVLVLTG